MTDTSNEQTMGPKTIAYHAILVEVLESGEMRMRIDNGFLADPPQTQTVRPLTGCAPVSAHVCLEQVEVASGEFLRMLRNVYPVDT